MFGKYFRTPPAPPPRWSKPTTPNSPTALTPMEGQLSNNFTVTTTVTFSVDGSQNSQIVEVTSPNSNTTVLVACNQIVNMKFEYFLDSFRLYQRDYHRKENVKLKLTPFHHKDRRDGNLNRVKTPVKIIRKSFHRIQLKHRLDDHVAIVLERSQNIIK